MTAESKPQPRRPDLLIYPTAAALRQVQRRVVERDGFFDGRRHLTLASFLRLCAEAAARAGLLRNTKGQSLRPITDLDRELAIVEAVSQFRNAAHPKNSILITLTPAALEEILEELTDTVAPLADRATEFISFLAQDRRSPKNPDLATLYHAYTAVCQTLLVADNTAVNTAILALLHGPRTQWPQLLQQASIISFLSVRWVAPFQESVIHALSTQLGHDHVHVHHILSEHEQDWWAQNLMTQAGRLLFDGSTGPEDIDGLAFQAPSTRAAIEELTTLREGYAMQDRALAEPARASVGFSTSVGLYGEIEDLARRISWELHDRTDPLRPEEICLVTRNLGTCSNAIMDVFNRFNIPYYFRRGVPLLAIPVIKTILNLARFSATRDREVFCALLESPWINWQGKGLDDPASLADDILRSGAEPILDDPKRLARRLVSYYNDPYSKNRQFKTREEAETQAKLVSELYQTILGQSSINTIDAGIADLLKRCKLITLGAQAEMLSGDTLSDRAGILNTKACEAALEILGTLRQHRLVADNTVNWANIRDLITRAFENLTVTPDPSDESGVWVLNPFDMAGLHFKVVLLAGMNAGEFPQLPTPSPLFPDAELIFFREHLLKHRPLPAAALAASKVRNSQENLLFLTTVAAARERIVFSYRRHGEDGKELTPSVFFSTLWRLTGWPTWPILPDSPPDPYDRWRLNQNSPHLLDHWRNHCAITPHKRRPFPGESFLGTVPLALCRAHDERWQRLAHQPGEFVESPTGGTRACYSAKHELPSAAEEDLAIHVAHGIRVEHDRQDFFTRQARAELGETNNAATPGDAYTGILSPELWAKIMPAKDGPMDFSPTQLEQLVACPYKYYLQYIAGVEPIERNELESSPRDFGTAIHVIMHEGFRLLQGFPATDHIPGINKVSQLYADLITPNWAVLDSKGVWHLQEGALRPSPDALPLVCFTPAATGRTLEFFDSLSEVILKWATSGNAKWMLGAPEQLTIQYRRIQRVIRNLVRAALEPTALPQSLTDTGEGQTFRRFPCLLEFTFNSLSKRADAPSIELKDPINYKHTVRLHGKIDRVDLVFDAEKILRAIIVVDYKGKSKGALSQTTLAAHIASAEDCQLPAYALAATSRFSTQSPAAIPVTMHYLSYSLSAEDMIKDCQKRWLNLDGQPLEAEELTDVLNGAASLMAAFTDSVFAALTKYERGEFVVAPIECKYCAFTGCCRHYTSQLAPDSEKPEDES
ncbi:MAG: PD-(D/E)XK nuclease family protein [bacterium]